MGHQSDIPQPADQPVPPVGGAVNNDDEEEGDVEDINGPPNEDNNENGDDGDDESDTASDENTKGEQEEEEASEEREEEENDENDTGDNERNDAYKQDYDRPAEPSHVEMTWANHLFQDTTANTPPTPTLDARTMRAKKQASKAERL
jgi:hypothetical protein